MVLEKQHISRQAEYFAVVWEYHQNKNIRTRQTIVREYPRPIKSKVDKMGRERQPYLTFQHPSHSLSIQTLAL